MSSFKEKKILLGVGGGIAAYKACDLLRRLTDQGAEVQVILTKAAQKFVTALTFQSLSGRAVHTDLFNLTEESEMSHITLADEADLVLVVPATADLVAKAACGLADDLLTTALLVTRAPVLFAPSMNVNMWEKPVVQTNVQTLQERGYGIIEPEEGYLACGWEGKGRLAETETILAAAESALGNKTQVKKKTLSGKKFLITAGPTREHLDPVRYISNPSTGKMGYALAAEAQARGAQVTLVSGPVELKAPQGVEVKTVTSAEEMLQACDEVFDKSHCLIATAAVGDYRPETIQKQKLKKNGQVLKLALQATPDILAKLSRKKRPGQIVVGFAAETQNLLEHAQEKLARKKLNLIVANDVSKPGQGFASDENEVLLLKAKGANVHLPKMPKTQLAAQLMDEIETLFLENSPQSKPS